jgi:hypothetical protein
MVVFDRAYNYYQQFALWTEKQVLFVKRLKKNAVFTVIVVMHRTQTISIKNVRNSILENECEKKNQDFTPGSLGALLCFLCDMLADTNLGGKMEKYTILVK